MVIIGTFSIRWTEREVVNVVWDIDGHGIRSGVSAHDYHLWIGIANLGYGELIVACYIVYRFCAC